MSDIYLRRLVERSSCSASVGGKVHCLHCCALSELDAIEQAAREHSAWHVTRESKQVLESIARESKP